MEFYRTPIIVYPGDRSHAATCDINGDGEITAADVTAIYSIIMGE